MSYDVWLSAKDALGDWYTPYDVGNYTSNCARMWDDALGYRLADLHERRAGDGIEDLKCAVTRMRTAPERYEAMNPPNGWGDHKTATEYLERLYEGCRRHPDAKIQVSH